jgi:hypothetical protein
MESKDAKWNPDTQSGTYSDKIHHGEMKRDWDNPKVESKQYFELVPVSVKPEREGWYEVQAVDAPEGNARECLYYFEGNWYDSDRDAKGGVQPLGIIPDMNLYLRPVSLPGQDGFLSVLEENYAATKSAINEPEVAFPGHSKMEAVIEAYEDILALYKKHISTPAATTQGEGDMAKWIEIWHMVHNSSNPMHFVESAELKAFIDKHYPASLPAAGGPTKDEIIALLDALRDIDLYEDVSDPPMTAERLADFARKALKTFFDKYQNYTL